ncbi:hypothetical protein SOVF_093230 [Spinacia oleracea]|nr:hypothetical protein SOVF_093230 [Spinacia oleracea]
MSSSSTTDRRSAGYKPSIWNLEFLESLKRDCHFNIEDEYANILERLKCEVKNMMADEELKPKTVFKTIDEIQRLGIGNHFGEDIERALRRLACNFGDFNLDLHTTALGFRLLRQNGIFMSQGTHPFKIMWWKDLGLSDKLSFARDRLMECFVWSVGTTSKLELSSCREVLTKVFNFITIIDDIYDVYGTIDELELFTNAIERWDINAIDELPAYMKLTFLALYNTINEIGHQILKQKGVNCIPYLKKTAEIERGETANAISCYAKQEGGSLKDARKHVKKLIDESWKGLNKIQVVNNTPFSKEFIETAMNLARTAQCFYQHGDGHGSPELIKKKISSIIVDPLQL